MAQPIWGGTPYWSVITTLIIYTGRICQLLVSILDIEADDAHV